MSAAAGWLLLGVVVGIGLDRGAAWTAAKARVLELEAAHEADLDRMAQLQLWQERAQLRAMGLDTEPSALQRRLDDVAARRRSAQDGSVLPLDRSKGRVS